jgi:hypothetical protein
MQESRYVTEIKKIFYQSLNIDKAVSPYQVWNKVNTNRPVYWTMLRHRLTPFSKPFKRIYDYKLWELEICTVYITDR